MRLVGHLESQRCWVVVFFTLVKASIWLLMTLPAPRKRAGLSTRDWIPKIVPCRPGLEPEEMWNTSNMRLPKGGRESWKTSPHLIYSSFDSTAGARKPIIKTLSGHFIDCLESISSLWRRETRSHRTVPYEARGLRRRKPLWCLHNRILYLKVSNQDWVML